MPGRQVLLAITHHPCSDLVTVTQLRSRKSRDRRSDRPRSVEQWSSPSRSASRVRVLPATRRFSRLVGIRRPVRPDNSREACPGGKRSASLAPTGRPLIETAAVQSPPVRQRRVAYQAVLSLERRLTDRRRDPPDRHRDPPDRHVRGAYARGLNPELEVSHDLLRSPNWEME